MAGRCQLCDGRIVNGKCVDCGMDYTRMKSTYHLNEDCDDYDQKARQINADYEKTLLGADEIRFGKREKKEKTRLNAKSSVKPNQKRKEETPLSRPAATAHPSGAAGGSGNKKNNRKNKKNSPSLALIITVLFIVFGFYSAFTDDDDYEYEGDSDYGSYEEYDEGDIYDPYTSEEEESSYYDDYDYYDEDSSVVEESIDLSDILEDADSDLY